MPKNLITFFYFASVVVICIFIFVSINFIILSNDPLQKNYTKIISAKIVYAIFIDIIAIGFSYSLYLIIRKLTLLEAETKDILILLSIIFTSTAFISLAVFLFIIMG